MNPETHFDHEEIITAIQMRTQEYLSDLSMMKDSEKIKKLVWGLYPFTSDLVVIPKTTYKLKEEYVTVTYPTDEGSLHIFNQMPELYFGTGLDNNLWFHDNPIVGIKFAPAEKTANKKVFTRIYLGEENIGYPTIPYTEVGFPLMGPVRFIPKEGGLEDVTYALYTYLFNDFKLEHKNLGVTSLLKPGQNHSDNRVMGYLESVRFASFLSLYLGRDGCEKLTKEWFHHPRFLVTPGTVTNLGGLSLEYPFTISQLSGLRDGTLDPFTALNIKFNGVQVNPNGVVQTAEPEQKSEVKKVPQLLLLNEINRLRSKLDMPLLKARWSLHGDIVDFEE